jgi:hypothetical protein
MLPSCPRQIEKVAKIERAGPRHSDNGADDWHLCWCWHAEHAEDVLQESKLDHPSPHPPTRIRSIYTIQPRGYHVIPAALLSMSFSQTPTRHSRFVDNKHQTPIRLSGDRTVEALFRLVIEFVLGSLPIALASYRFSNIVLYRLHPEALPDSSRFRGANQERIEEIAIFSALPARSQKKRGFSGKG